MLPLRFFIFFLFLVHPVYALGTSITLAQRWDTARNTKAMFPPQILAGKHVVFIPGIMNELAAIISNYYPDNIEAAREMGATTLYIGSSSSNSIPENAKILYARIQSIAKQVQQPLILVGHSKGGAEVLHLVLEHPELIRDGTIERVLLIQPAIGGSPLAGTPSLLMDFVSIFWAPNLNTLCPNQAKANFDRAFAVYERALLKVTVATEILTAKNRISKRIFYVRGQQDPGLFSLGVNIVLGVSQASLGDQVPSDGLLPVASQFDPRIGIDLGILRADHIDLVVSEVSNLSKKDRKAFTYAAFEQIYLDE